MNNASDMGTAQLRRAEEVALRAASENEHLATAAMALLHCRTAEDVYDVIGDFLLRLIPGAVVVVNEATPEFDGFITRTITGLDDSALAQAANLLGFKIVGFRSDIVPSLRDRLRSGNLSQIHGGVAELASNTKFRPLAEAGGKVFGIREVFTIGISDRDVTLGNVHILTRAPDSVVPTHVIESFAHHCFSALTVIVRMAELAETAERDALLVSSMVEGLALHEVILDDAGRPCDFRFLDVNPAFEAMMDLKTTDIVGRTMLEGRPDTDPAFIARLGAVALTGKADRFEHFASHPGRHLELVAYSPKRGQVATVLSDATERVRLEEITRRRLAALTRPSSATGGLTFSDLFDIENIQSIQDSFAAATGVASVITEPDGTPITRPSNFCRLCNDVIRKTAKGMENCRRSDAAIGCQNPSGPIIQPCLSGGLWDAGASINVGGEHVANWLIGQVRNARQDDAELLKYADEVGADREEFKAAMAEVPTMPLERFELIAQALFLFASELSDGAYHNMQQARFITERKQMEEGRTDDLERLRKALLSTVEIVSQVVESRDPYTAGHQRRVCELATLISREMGMAEEQVEEIRTAALIHDVGKMSVPTEILSRPGALSRVEFELVKAHAEAGHRIISESHMEGPTAEIVYQHHERCDGSGYPRGLRGDELLPASKVLMVADVVEAMISHRPYRPALGQVSALAEIEAGAGTLYDPEVSRACVALFRTGRIELS